MRKRIGILILVFLFIFNFTGLTSLKVLAAENKNEIVLQIEKITSDEGAIPITGYFLGRVEKLNFMNCSIFIDGIPQNGSIMSGLDVNVSRPDLKIKYSQYRDAENSGFEYKLDSTSLSNGKHKLKIDFAGNVKEMEFNTNNKPKIIEFDKISSEEGVIPITGYFLGRGKILNFMNCNIFIDGIPQNGTPMELNVNECRPELKIKYPNYKNAENSGFNYNVNTINLSNGIHKIKFDFAGNEKEISFNVNNKPLIFEMDKVDSEECEIDFTGYILGLGKSLSTYRSNFKVYIDNVEILCGDLYVDQSRPELKQRYPIYKNEENNGFKYELDSTKLSNGTHKIKFNFCNKEKEIQFKVNNKSKIFNVDNISSEKGIINITGYLLGGGRKLHYMNCDISVDGENLISPGLITDISRPELKQKYPLYKNAESSGFKYELDTTVLKNGTHKIKFDFAGDIKEVSFNVNNIKKIFEMDSTIISEGKIDFSGYVLGNASMLSFLNSKIYVDDNQIDYPLSDLSSSLKRSELKDKYPLYVGAENSGFKYKLDTTSISNGKHVIKFNFLGLEKSILVNVNNKNISPDKSSSTKYVEFDPVLSEGGMIKFTGFVLGNSDGLNSIISSIYIDNKRMNTLTNPQFNLSRPDLLIKYPIYDLNNNRGFSYDLDSTKLGNGKHTLKIDFGGYIKEIEFNVNNKPKMIEFDKISLEEGIIPITGYFLGRGESLNFMNCNVLIDDKRQETLMALNVNASRPELKAKYSQYEDVENSGFNYELDSTMLNNGKHKLKINFAGDIKEIEFNVNNKPKIIEFDKISSEEGIIPITGYFLGRSKSLNFINCNVFIDNKKQESLMWLDVNVSRSELKVKYPQYKDAENNGFRMDVNTVNLTNVMHKIKLDFAGDQKEISFNVNNKKPILQVESITQKKQGLLEIKGYKLSSFNSIDVKVYIDGILYNSNLFSYQAGIDSADLVDKFKEYKNAKNCRFKYLINTTKMINGEHKIKFVWPEVSIEQKIIVNNPAGTKEKEDYDIMFGDNLQDGIDTINKVVKDITVIVNDMAKTMDDMAKTMDDMAKTLDGMNRTTAQLNTTLGEVVKIVDNLNSSMQQTISGIDQCNKASAYLIKMNTNASIIMAQRCKDEKEKLEKQLKIQEEMKNQYYSKWYNCTWEYIKSSINQVGMGKYSNEVTVLGTVGEIGLGIFNLDAVADIRDLSHDVKYWEWRWSNAGEITLDTIGLFPVIGIIKYGDEAGIIIKDGEKFNVKKVKGLSKGVAKAGELASSVKWKGFSKGELGEHFKKHGHEFGDISQNEYLKLGKDFAAEINTAFRETQVGNFIIKYDDATRRVIVGQERSREIRTFYKADFRDVDPFEAAVNLAKELSGIK